MPPMVQRLQAYPRLNAFTSILTGRQLRADIRGWLNQNLPSLRATRPALPGVPNAFLPNNIMMMADNGQAAAASSPSQPPAAPAKPASQPKISPPPTNGQAPTPPTKSGHRARTILAYTAAALGAAAAALFPTFNVMSWVAPTLLLKTYAASFGGALALSLAGNILPVLLLTGLAHLAVRRLAPRKTAAPAEPPALPTTPRRPTTTLQPGGKAEPTIDVNLVNQARQQLEELRAWESSGNQADQLAELAVLHQHLEVIRRHDRSLSQLPEDIRTDLAALKQERVTQLTELSRQHNLLINDAHDKGNRTKSYFLLPVTPEVQARIDRKVHAGRINQPLLNNAHWLGSGAMGEVYLAVDAASGERVAIKVLREKKFENRFREEFRTMSEIDHQSVAKAHAEGVCTINNVDYPLMAMEYIAWPELNQVINSEVFSAKEAVRVARAISAAMNAVHDQGLFHRDLKPANIFYDRTSGQVKITDFGLAKDVHSLAEATATGIMAGTPAYMSPSYYSYAVEHSEQRDPAILRDNDVYAVGVILYKMLTGYTMVWEIESQRRQISDQDVVDRATRQPIILQMNIGAIIADYSVFTKASDARELQRLRDKWRLVQDFTPLAGVRARVKIDDVLFAVIRQATEWDKVQRYSDMHELMSDLDRYLDDKPLRKAPAQAEESDLVHAATRLSDVPQLPEATVAHGRPAEPAKAEPSAAELNWSDLEPVSGASGLTECRQLIGRINLAEREARISALNELFDLDPTTLSLPEQAELLRTLNELKLASRDDREMLNLAVAAYQYFDIVEEA